MPTAAPSLPELCSAVGRRYAHAGIRRVTPVLDGSGQPATAESHDGPFVGIDELFRCAEAMLIAAHLMRAEDAGSPVIREAMAARLAASKADRWQFRTQAAYFVTTQSWEHQLRKEKCTSGDFVTYHDAEEFGAYVLMLALQKSTRKRAA